MAEPAISNESAHPAVLHHKYPPSCSPDNDYSSVKTLSDFAENISSPPSDYVSPRGDLQFNFSDGDVELPNNNDEGLMDCLVDGGCASNASATSKMSSASSFSPGNSETPSQCSSIPESPDCDPQLDCKLKQQLIVKLETQNFDVKGNYVTDKSEPVSNSVDVNNGVVKKKRKHKDNSHATKAPAGQKPRVQAGRGRPPKRPLMTTYHSQISGDKNTIKIRIKKALSQQIPPVKKSRQRKKQKKEASDSDVSDYDDSNKRLKLELVSHLPIEDHNRSSSPVEQTVWGDTNHLPTEILRKIFQFACNEGSLPLLITISKVCKIWRDVSLDPKLWESVDLSNCVKERYKTDVRLHWFIHNRLATCQDLNLTDWKIKNIPAMLEELCENCPELRGLNLGGWSGLTAENLKYITSACQNLERVDLSFVNGSNPGTKSALNASPLVCLAQNMTSRLTHLILAHNKLAGFSQIITAISAHCPNLQLLDLSNIKTHAYNGSLLQVEKLQEGCPKIRVLRVTNSQILLAPTSLSDQVASPGFPDLEELSLAGIEDDNTTSKFIDDNGVERILKTSHKLRLLDVRGCTKITDSGLVKVPAWDLEHLFLSACYVTRLNHSGLELIVQKWSHSLVEVDLAWSTATEPLDAAVMTLAEQGKDSPLRILNLCGSSVSLESVKAVLLKCPHIQSLNLQSCRALPRGIKRLYEGSAVTELRASLENKPKTEDLDSTGSEEPPAEGGAAGELEKSGNPTD